MVLWPAISRLSKYKLTDSDGGHKALRASAISAFVNMVHEARLMWLDARKMHLGAAFYAI